MKLVLDVSNQNPITLQALKESGAVALECKATEGTSIQDKTLGAHRDVARKAGVPFGSYVFLHPDSQGSEAAFYVKYARPRPGDIQPVIDSEVTKIGIPELARRTDSCARALEAVGYSPLLYASAAIWQELVKVDPGLKRLPVWEAAYPGRYTRWFPRLAKLRIRLGSGVSVVMWQWTSGLVIGDHRYDASALLVDLRKILIPGGKASAL